MNAVTATRARIFLVETLADESTDVSSPAEASWAYIALTTDIEAAIVALAKCSMEERLDLSRLRVGKIEPSGGISFREALRMASGGRFLTPSVETRRAIDVGGLLDTPPLPSLAPPSPRFNRHSEPKRSGALPRYLGDAAVFAGSAALALLMFAILAEDTSDRTRTVVKIPERPSLLESTALNASAAGTEGSRPLGPSVMAPPLPLAAPPLPTEIEDPEPWHSLLFGLSPADRLEDVKERFTDCFAAADGSQYCEGDTPSEITDAGLFVANFKGDAPHVLSEVLLQSRAFEGPSSRQRAEVAFDRLSDWVDRRLEDHRRSDREDLPPDMTFWEALKPGSGTGMVERHWAPKDPTLAPYVRLRLVGKDEGAGYYLLQVSSPAGWTPGPLSNKL